MQLQQKTLHLREVGEAVDEPTLRFIVLLRVKE